MHAMPSRPFLNLTARAKERQFHREKLASLWPEMLNDLQNDSASEQRVGRGFIIRTTVRHPIARAGSPLPAVIRVYGGGHGVTRPTGPRA